LKAVGGSSFRGFFFLFVLLLIGFLLFLVCEVIIFRDSMNQH
jgi:hypothetical protein